jgi:predicted nucleic acid-binding protein
MEYRGPRVFVDADALIAGSASTSGASHLILRLGELGLIDVMSSAQVRGEVERNLARKVPAALPAFRALAEAACSWVPDPSKVTALRGQADPKDLPILAAAIQAECEWLVTFNTKHFRPTGNAIRVATPGKFVEALRSLLEELANE